MILYYVSGQGWNSVSSGSINHYWNLRVLGFSCIYDGVWSKIAIFASFFTFEPYLSTKNVFLFQMIIDTIFICFCEDCDINDGQERPYFMSKDLMVNYTFSFNLSTYLYRILMSHDVIFRNSSNGVKKPWKSVMSLHSPKVRQLVGYRKTEMIPLYKI